MKTKALINFAVTKKLISVFVFAYTKCWFSHDAAHFSSYLCRHYENYMGCVKYQALIQDVDCTMETIDTFSPDKSICPGLFERYAIFYMVIFIFVEIFCIDFAI